jgi:hypothetical protein
MDSSKGSRAAPLKREHSRGKKGRACWGGRAERSSAHGVVGTFGGRLLPAHIVSPCRGFVDADHLLDSELLRVTPFAHVNCGA